MVERLMNRSLTGVAAFFPTFLFLLLSSLFASTEGVLPEEILSVVANPIYRYARWGIHVVDLDTNQTLYSVNAGELFHPASITKLFTAAAALEHLGGEYRIRTTIFGDGFVDSKGTFHGNLIIVPRGDIFLNGWERGFGKSSMEEQTLQNGLKTLACSLKDRGISRVKGNLIVDDLLFEHRSIFSFSRPGLCLYTMAPSAFEGNTKDPSRHLLILFRRILNKEGIRILPARAKKGKIRKYFSSGKLVLAEYESPPLREYLRVIVKYSHNPGADVIPMLLAVKDGKRTFEEGVQRMKDVLLIARIDPKAVSLGDGSGISPVNMVTPESVVRLLVFMHSHRESQVFKECLSVLGVDGTLRSAGKSPLSGRLIGKTGTLSGVDVLNNSTLVKSKGLAGYMTTAKGRSLAFAIIVNDVHLLDIKDAKSSLVHLEDVSKDLVRVAEIIYMMN